MRRKAHIASRKGHIAPQGISCPEGTYRAARHIASRKDISRRRHIVSRRDISCRRHIVSRRDISCRKAYRVPKGHIAPQAYRVPKGHIAPQGISRPEGTYRAAGISCPKGTYRAARHIASRRDISCREAADRRLTPREIDNPPVSLASLRLPPIPKHGRSASLTLLLLPVRPALRLAPPRTASARLRAPLHREGKKHVNGSGGCDPPLRYERPRRPPLRYERPRRSPLRYERPRRPPLRYERPRRPPLRYERPRRPPLRDNRLPHSGKVFSLREIYGKSLRNPVEKAR